MAEVDYYLKLDGIEGESSDAGHKGELDIESYSWGVTQNGTHSKGGGGGAGKATFQDMNFVARASKASPRLMEACASGEHIKSAVLVCRRAGKEQQEYLKYTLSDCIVSSFQTGGSAGSVVPTDSFSLNFAKFECEYKEQKPDGTLGGAVKKGYNLKENKVV